jgi:glycosyltransferase involved in cell wall biosynthesis
LRIIQIVPGTGNFHCGTCLREHALARGLRRLGQDVLMAPLYLPLVLEREADGEGDGRAIFFGGVNIFLQQKSKLFDHTPRWLDRWLDAPALLRRLAERSGSTRASQLGVMTVSMLRGDEGRQNKELARLCAWLAKEARPDIVCLGTGLLVGLARRIKSATGAAVMCTLHGEDAFLDGLPEPYREQAWSTMRARARDVDVLLPVSRYYGDVMTRRLELPQERVHVVHNGIELDGLEPGPPPQHPTIGFLARMCPGKGLATLADAYLILRSRGRVADLKLRIAGAKTGSDEAFVRELRTKFEAAGALDDVTFAPNLDREQKVAFLRTLTVLSVPATYGEAFGLYILEALACAVPVVQPRHGAFPEVLAATGGGTLCNPDDAEDLAAVLEKTLLTPESSRAEARRARQIVVEKFSADRMARQVLDMCEKTLREV